MGCGGRLFVADGWWLTLGGWWVVVDGGWWLVDDGWHPQRHLRAIQPPRSQRHVVDTWREMQVLMEVTMVMLL